MTFHTDPGTLVRIERGKRGWSQARLAQLAGVSPPTVRDFENGVKKTHARNIVAIASALGIDPADLMEVPVP